MIVGWMLFAGCVAMPFDSSWARTTQHDAWQRADVDGDGRLSRVEARRMPRLARVFNAIDSDADGFISAGEVRAWRAARRKGTPRPTGADEILRLADADRDGRLTPTEIQAHAPRLARFFSLIDTDTDGAVSRVELLAWLGARRERARVSFK